MRAALPVALIAALVVAGCGNGGGTPAPPEAIMVNAADDACAVAKTELPAGQHVFRVVNGGAKVTEFYVYGPDNRIVGEVENIAPGLSRDLLVNLPAGAYQAACKPGMTGDGIRQPLTVTGASTAIEDHFSHTELSDAINALAEPVSRVGAAISAR